MKKQKNYSQLKEQVKSPERTSNETDLPSLHDPKSKKEVIKMLKGEQPRWQRKTLSTPTLTSTRKSGQSAEQPLLKRTET